MHTYKSIHPFTGPNPKPMSEQFDVKLVSCKRQQRVQGFTGLPT